AILRAEICESMATEPTGSRGEKRGICELPNNFSEIPIMLSKMGGGPDFLLLHYASFSLYNVPWRCHMRWFTYATSTG
ncbi:hypothetical protein ACJX0J_025595, partial [Zea mays]